MEYDWKQAVASIEKITVTSNLNNEPVTIHEHTEDLKCIGVGTDAAVFQSINVPAYAFKIYAEDKVAKRETEKSIYKTLEGSPYFATCFSSGDRYLVLSYEEGITLFDCLLRGINIPEQVITDVEDAREEVRRRGLNPRDIHLKNVLLQHGRAKIFDVSEYGKPGNDYRWEHLKEGYETYYALIDGKAVPHWLAETVRKWYNKKVNHFSSFEEFKRMLVSMSRFYMK